MGASDYKPQLPGRYRGLKPYPWPQDNLTVPNGYGSMPRVEALNANLTKREWYCYNTEIAAIGVGGIAQATIATDADGDFWLDSIAIGAVVNDYATAWQQMPDGHIQIKDANQGYNLFPARSLTDGAPLAQFQIMPDNYVPPLTYGTLSAAGAGLRSSIVQPYCFLRSGAIAITVSLEAWTANYSYRLFVNLSGWKEYASAAA